MLPVLAGAVLAAPLQLSNSGEQRQTIFFVPELRGAFTLDLVLENRFGNLIDPYSFDWQPLGGAVALGWRHYLDGWGQTSIGANLGMGFEPGGGDESVPSIYHPRVGVSVRLRGLSPDFMSFTLGLYGEVGPLFIDGGAPPRDFPELDGESTGLGWAVGLETGPGMLTYLSPYIFGELTGRLGLEVVRVGGIDVRQVIAGVRLGFDWAMLKP